MGSYLTKPFYYLFSGIDIESECKCFNCMSDNELLEVCVDADKFKKLTSDNKNGSDENDGPNWMMEKHYTQTAQDNKYTTKDI